MAAVDESGPASIGEGAPGIQMVCPTCNKTFPGDASVCQHDGSGLLEVPDAPLLSGTVMDDRYEIGNVIGSGGMGVVYRATQRAMERDVAIKVLHPQFAHDPRAVKRFFREAQASSRLVHPNVVTVYDFGRARSSHLYMVMELLEGWTLGDLIYHRAPLSPATVVSLGVQVCDALEAAHKRRIVHRDLKPDNVQLVTRDGAIWAKVLDFGIARLMRDDDANLGMHLSTVDIAGTPAYMSPEQIMGKDPDPRSDLYSLGVILYEALTGERPFEDDNSVALCMKQLNESPPEMATFLEAGTVPADLEALVLSLLAKEQRSRLGSARAVREALARCSAASSAVRAPTPDSLRDKGGRRTLGVLPTRPDAGPLMLLPTLDARAGDDAPAAAIARLGAVIDRVQSDAPAIDVERPKRAGRAAAAVGAVMAGRAADFAEGFLASWLQARRDQGWAVEISGTTAIVSVPRHNGTDDGIAVRQLVERLLALNAAARKANLAIRAGVARADRTGRPDEGTLPDTARRFAAAAPPGEVAAAASVARELSLRGRPLTSVFLPAGQSIACWALDASPREGADDGDMPWGFIGRNRELRRLGGLADEARHAGPVAALVTGPCGAGRTTLLQAFARGRQHLYVRVSPLADAWPGHGAAAIVLACLGLPADAASQAIKERIEPLPLHLRDRLAVLFGDAEPAEEISAGGISRAIADAISWLAGDEPFCLFIDDAHFLDDASHALLADLPEVAQGKPWLLVAAAPVVTGGEVSPNNVLFAGHAEVDLRPLGLRAAGELVDALEVPTPRRAAVLAAGGGNALATRLLARLPAETPIPRGRDVIRLLLPEALRAAAAPVARAAWLGALAGAVEAADDLPVRAARLYLATGLPDDLRRWLLGQVRVTSGLQARLIAGLTGPVAADPARARRLAALGLWSLAADAANAAAAVANDGGVAARLRFDAARLMARAGDVTAALRCFETVMEQDEDRVDSESLVRFAAILLEAREHTRAEAILLRARKRLGERAEASCFGEMAALLSRCAVRRAAIGEAMALLGRAREAIELLRRGAARETRALEALVQEVRAEVALAEGDADATRTNLAQARDAYRDLGRSRDAIRCLVQLGRLELDDGEPSRAADTFRAASGLAQRAGLLGPTRHARIGLGESLVALGEIDEGTAILRRMLRECSEPNTIAAVTTALADAMNRCGFGEDAVRYAERALGLATAPRQRVRALYALAAARMLAGDYRRAARVLVDATATVGVAGHGLLAERVQELTDDLTIVHGITLPPARGRVSTHTSPHV